MNPLKVNWPDGGPLVDAHGETINEANSGTPPVPFRFMRVPRRGGPTPRRAERSYLQLLNLKENNRVAQLNEPFTGMYSCAYHMVQSSTGSTAMLE